MASNKKSNSGTLFTVILAAFIDMLGIAIIVPVLAPLIINNETGIVSYDMSESMRTIVYGLMLSSYSLAQFFGAPILGALSDRHGRKKMLMISLSGSVIGYVIFALGIVFLRIELLFIGRIIDGFTGGNISIVFSAVSDISTPEKRAQNFGLVGMAFGLGFVLGPFIGGILSDPELVPWFGPVVPFIVAAGLCAFNVVLVKYIFQETLKVRSTEKVSLFKGFSNFGRAFKMPNLSTLFMVGFFLTLGFAFFTQFYSVLLIDNYGYDERDIGMLYGYIGLWIAFTQGGLIRIVGKRFSSSNIIRISALVLALSIPLILIPDQPVWQYYIVPLIAIFQGLTAPNLNATVSRQASPEQQGEILGINQSIASLGNAIPPLVAGLLSTLDSSLPTLAAGAFILIGWFIFTFFFKEQKG